MPALHIQDAVKTYANGFTALRGVSFDVAEGEFFALFGPDGAGKTTLISAMAGLSRLTSGRIRVMGHDVEARCLCRAHELGRGAEELVFDPFFSVREALQFQSGYFGLKNNDDWIDEIITNLGLADKADTNTRNLSGGMKRRVMVAQALVHAAPVIVLDEPTAGVDVELRQSLWAFIQNLNRQGHTIILTTHYLEEAQSLCDRIAMMKQGVLVALDSTEHLCTPKKACAWNCCSRVRCPTICRAPGSSPQTTTHRVAQAQRLSSSLLCYKRSKYAGVKSKTHAAAGNRFGRRVCENHARDQAV